jgi:hypothetical protein
MSKDEKGLTMTRPYFYGKVPITFDENEDPSVDWESLGLPRNSEDVSVIYDNAIVNLADAMIISNAIDEDDKPCVRISKNDGTYFVIYTTIEKILDECFTDKRV